MIRIFIETGENQAKKNDKKITNEQDFVIKFIEHHFPGKVNGVDFEVKGLGGKDTLENSAPVFQLTNEGDVNLLIFDADGPANGGGFAVRKADIERQRLQLHLNFELFLWPNNSDDGDFESLVLEMINPQHQGVLDCFEGFEKCVGGHDPEGLLYELPGRKGEAYTYIELMKLSTDERKSLHKGYWHFENPKFWDLDAAAGNALKTFLQPFFIQTK